MAFSRAVLLVVLLDCISFPSSYGQTLPSRSGLTDSNLEGLVQNLWSADDRVRWAAKLDLIEVGSRAEPYLLTLLTELSYHTEQPHFAIAKKPQDQDHARDFAGAQAALKLDITWRLIWDCCELLGDLKSEKAVPALIRVMAKRTSLNLFEKMSLEMRALAKIGEPSIPELLETLESAVSIAESITGSSTKGAALANTATRVLSDNIRQRAAIVLGEIGNPRALQALKNLLSVGGPFEHGNVYVESAIRQIESRR